MVATPRANVPRMVKVKSPVGDPRDSLGYLLVRASDQARKTWEQSLAEYDVRARSFSILAMLQHEPGLSSAELARRTMITPQSMSEALKSLAIAGLVAVTDETPGRSNRLEVTGRGRRLLRRSSPAVQAANESMFGLLNSQERDQLRRLLEKLVRDA